MWGRASAPLSCRVTDADAGSLPRGAGPYVQPVAQRHQLAAETAQALLQVHGLVRGRCV